MFKNEINRRGENRGNYHNLKRQRGIYGDPCKTLQLNPSLTFRVVMAANSQLQKVELGGGGTQTITFQTRLLLRECDGRIRGRIRCQNQVPEESGAMHLEKEACTGEESGAMHLEKEACTVFKSNSQNSLHP
jgi:hypothetical protein